SRLATQKGFDLFHEIAQELFTKHNVQFVVLGAGEQRYHDLFEKLHATYPDKVGIRLGVYDEPLAHLIYAGADMFIMPSRYEPCGLGQMISLRYGTIPIVRYTGGLADTVREFNPDTGEGNGFGFYKPIGAEFLRAIERALNTYASRELWHRIVHNAMDADFSWKRSAQEYVEVYRRAVAERKATI
ncbi:MAG TPA: glycosyltransferase, partial [Armatimonadetes bacterium]|nr:glycosyltransferase [Armatimonadota bacterium]